MPITLMTLTEKGLAVSAVTARWPTGPYLAAERWKRQGRMDYAQARQARAGAQASGA